MFVLDESSGKVQLDYPCSWIYKVIGRSEASVRGAIAEVVEERLHTITISNTSAQGNYICLNLEMQVLDEEDRQSIYRSLKQHPDTVIIL